MAAVAGGDGPGDPLGLVLPFGAVHAWQSDDRSRAELVRLLAADDPQIRLAAVHALATSDPRSAAEHVDTLVRAVLDPAAEHWQESAWIGGTRAAIVHSAGGLLAGDPVAATAFVTGVSRGGGTDERVAAVAQAGKVLAAQDEEFRVAAAAITRSR